MIDKQRNESDCDTFILKQGDLECYCNTKNTDKIGSMISFITNNNNVAFAKIAQEFPLVNEIDDIFKQILQIQ